MIDEHDLAKRTVIATTTLYNSSERDTLRTKITARSIHQAVERGYDVIVVDGGSSRDAVRQFERAGAEVYSSQRKGMGNDRRQAIEEAHRGGREFIAWTEPEKVDYVAQIHRTVRPLADDLSDLIVPRRMSMASYPTAQQYAEQMGNLFWKTLTGTKLDLWFGPRTWKKEMSEYFIAYDGKYGDLWEALYIPVMDMLADGRKVSGVEVDYTHPRQQTILEENDLTFFQKRLVQLNNLLPALEAHWKTKQLSKD